MGDYNNPGVGDYDLHDPVDNQNGDEDEQGDDSDDESNNGDNNDDNESINAANEENETIENEMYAPTETEMFRIAADQGRANAAVPNATRPRRNVRPSRYDDFNGTPGGKKIDTPRKFSLLVRSQSAPNPSYSSL